MSEKDNVVKYKNPINFNIGVVIFVIIIIYVVFNVFSYFTKTSIAEYQVQQGTIASNHVYQGLIIRDETIEYAQQNGYVDYYIKNGSKVAVTDTVYSIDTIGNISSKIASSNKNNSTISDEETLVITERIDSFLKNYDSNDFRTSYSFLHSLNSEIIYNINTQALITYATDIEQAKKNQTFYEYASPLDGIILYELDGYEDYTTEEAIASELDSSSYQKTYLNSNRKVTTNDPVYKRINSENWNIIVPIEEDLAKELNEKSSIKIRFCKDDFTLNVSSSVLKKNNTYFLKLSLNTGMIRYIDLRFVDIELVMKETTGLKIPVSAITSKEFYTIPKSYFTLGNQELIVKKMVEEEETLVVVKPTIYYETDEFYYIDSEHVALGDILQMPDSMDTYIVGTDVDSLIGVYNINKGYAVFKQINILHEGNEYAIIESKTTYGISLYDHIALDASQIKENQLITK